jgi:hypothetical protein
MEGKMLRRCKLVHINNRFNDEGETEVFIRIIHEDTDLVLALTPEQVMLVVTQAINAIGGSYRLVPYKAPTDE